MQANLSKRINELLVLAVLERGPAHGYQIALSVEEETGGVFTFQHGTLYPILHRLDADGLVRGTWDRGGRRKKIYGITATGREHLARDAASLVEQFNALLLLIGASNAA